MSPGEKTSQFAYASGRSLQPGQTLAGRYRIVQLLGHGGMGEVYEAEDTVLGMQVALKTIRGESNELSVRRFQREVVLARSVAHTNVCRVFDFGSDETAGAFYTMELLRGETLADHIRQRGAVSLADARRIASEVARALQAAHALGIIHRDLKPANIFLTEDHRVVVTDFGLARSAGDGERGVAYTPGVAPYTSASLVAGTPAYMAPEQLSGSEATVVSDIYALGIVMYEMSAGRLPWADAGSARFLATPQPPRVEPVWDGIVLRCLSLTPGSRFGSAEELRNALVGKRRRIPARWWVAAALAVVVTMTALLFLTSQRKWAPRPEAASWYERGLSALHDGDFNSAAKQFQMASEADPNFAMAQARLAEAWAEQDYSDRARQAMLQASTVAATYPVANRTDELRLLAIQMMVARDFQGSRDRYRQIAASEKKPDTLFDYARALERNSQTADAIAEYREAISMQDSFAASWARLAFLLARGGKFADAAAAFDKAAMLYKASGNLAGLAEVDLRRSQVMSQQGQLAEAQRILNDAVKLAEATGFESQRIRILMRRGVLARMQGRSEEAERNVSEALNLANENRMEQYTVDGLLDLGNVYLQKLDLENAEKHYSNALRTARSLNSRYHEARAIASLASVRSQQGRLDDARSGAEKALAYYRTAGYQNEALSMLTLLAQVRSQAGDSAGALAAFEEQLKLTNPKNARAVAALHLRIGIALANLERFSEALLHLNSAVSAPDAVTRAYAAVNKAEILVTTGDLTGGRAILNDSSLLTEQSGTVLQRAAVVQTGALLAEERYAEAASAASDAFRKFGSVEPTLAARLRSLYSIAASRNGNVRQAISLCRSIEAGAGDAKASAAATLNCAEAGLASNNTVSARRRASEARAALEKLDQPGAEWRACTVEAMALPRPEAGQRLAVCEPIEKAAAQRWGNELWDRYLNRADVRTRLVRLRKLKQNKVIGELN